MARKACVRLVNSLLASLSLLLLVYNCGYVLAESQLELVSDNELLNLIQSEKYVVTLFTKKNCPSCEELETELATIREDLVDSFSAWVVKSNQSPLVKQYSPDGEPAIVFFRHGIAMLYDGPADEDVLLETFLQSKEPAVKELSDENFEHLTQAATGATTGDWFVMFYGPDCFDCLRLQARWEAVGAKLANRINVARVNKKGPGASTSRRFGVAQLPTFILFRAGKMYRYDIPKHDVSSFVAFASGWYKNVASEKVPVPKSPFDDLVDATFEFLKENIVMMKLACLGIVIILGIIYVSTRKQTPEKTALASRKKK